MKSLYVLFSIFWLSLVNCTPNQTAHDSIPKLTAVTHADEHMVRNSVQGQTVYVPIYSHIPHVGSKDILSLRAILSIRNTSDKENLIISRIDYYDTNGKLLRQHLTKPVSLGKMATMDVEVSTMDLSGGTGANFIVRWDAANRIASPIIESLMYGSSGPQSFSFTSRGQEVEAH